MPHKRRRLIIIVLVSASILAVAVFGVSQYFRSFVAALYEPVPIQAAGEGDRTVLCLGDSITHGNVSANYVASLRDAFSGESVRFVNGGINGDMVYDVSVRLDDLLEAVGTVDIITLLIGTNDANATLDSEVGQRVLEHVDDGIVPDSDYYRANLEILVERIAGETGAKVILISIPPIGENPKSLEWERSQEFAIAGKETASATGMRYVPFSEIISALIVANQLNPQELPAYEDWYTGMVTGLILRHFFDKDYTTIGDRSGYEFHSDQLHLNERGAAVLVDLLEPELRDALEDLAS